MCLDLVDDIASEPPEAIAIAFLALLLFYRDEVVSLTPQPPTWRTRMSLFVWVITFDLSDVGDPTSSNAIARIALKIKY